MEVWWCEEEEEVAAKIEDSAVSLTSSMGEVDGKERLGEVYVVAGNADAMTETCYCLATEWSESTHPCHHLAESLLL